MTDLTETSRNVIQVTFSENFKSLRDFLGYSQNEFSEVLKTTRTRLSSYERAIALPGPMFLLYLEENTGIPMREWITKRIKFDKVAAKGFSKALPPNTAPAIQVAELQQKLKELEAENRELKSKYFDS